jgi:hypothetical protein
MQYVQPIGGGMAQLVPICVPTDVSLEFCLFKLLTDGEVSNYPYILNGLGISKLHFDLNQLVRVCLHINLSKSL